MTSLAEGVLALNKPQGISSAQALRDLQTHFNPSKLFAPWLERERENRARESKFQKKRRRDKRPPQVKIGHGGTLDPLATGVLIAGLGSGTKELQQFLECTKEYETVVLFGVATDSYDRLGKVLAHAEHGHLTREVVENALGTFRGKIMQKPPIFSALRVQGKKLYEYAREGKQVPVEIEERPVEVLNLELVEWLPSGSHEFEWPKEQAPQEEKKVAGEVLHMKTDDSLSEIEKKGIKREREGSEDDDASKKPRQTEDSAAKEEEPKMRGALPTAPDKGQVQPAEQSETAQHHTESSSASRPPAARLLITSTSGFYVRSLCHDLGAAVGSLGIMAELKRTRQGQFALGGDKVLEFDDLKRGEEFWGPKVERLLKSWNEPEKPDES